MSKDVKELLKEATKDLLTPETLTAIEEAVNTKADEKAKLQVEAALIDLDNRHAEMLNSLMEKMDVDYTDKLQKLVKRLDEAYAHKLLKVKDTYEGKISKLNEQLNESAQKYIDSLNQKVDIFLESQIDKLLPSEKLNEAVENVKAVHILEQIRSLVGINEAFVSTEIKAALVDGKKQIDESVNELQSVVTENNQLKARLSQIEADLLLEQKTVKLPSKKREHIKQVCAGKGVSFIKENFDYISNMFDRKEVIDATNAKKTAEKVAEKVDTPQVIIESRNDNRSSVESTSPFMKDYLTNLK